MVVNKRYGQLSEFHQEGIGIVLFALLLFMMKIWNSITLCLWPQSNYLFLFGLPTEWRPAIFIKRPAGPTQPYSMSEP